ncbi:MAG: cobyrinate a,c-diamide synthase [Deltaproteobacteria bacterium]|nr:cobyrinate a,c-diamide synthase [Deltaproteobacteria bacterium]
MTDTATIISFCVAGTHSGAGKTTVTLGLLAAFRERGIRVQPFKCGPDYLDPGHHEAACGTISRNLDSWMMGREAVAVSYRRALAGREAAIIEGVMGLFDGARPGELAGSTAEVAMILQLPVILVIDVRAMAGSAAALVKGFAEFADDLEIAGVIANNVGSERHRKIIATALEVAGLPPLLGALPKNSVPVLAERHLGLVSAEPEKNQETYRRLGRVIAEHVDLDRLIEKCRRPRPQPPVVARKKTTGRKPRLGLARDEAFQFYYADNLDGLKRAGIEIVEFSPLREKRLPERLDGLYLGGGYPELYAADLSNNPALRQELTAFAEGGGAIYAECGGLMFLGRELLDLNGARWPMTGILPLTSEMGKKRFRLGYVEARNRIHTIFGPPGTTWRGHKFHWSRPTPEPAFPEAPISCLRPGGETPEAAGFSRLRVLGTYIHAHFGHNPAVADNWAAYLKNGR